MPRYFFHARLGDEQIPDREGVEVESLENVRDLIAEVAKEHDIKGAWEFEVTDAAGKIHLVVAAADLVTREN